MQSAISELTGLRAVVPSVVTMAGLPRRLPAFQLGRAGGCLSGNLTRSTPIAFHSTNMRMQLTVRSAAGRSFALPAVGRPAADAHRSTDITSATPGGVESHRMESGTKGSTGGFERQDIQCLALWAAEEVT